MAGVFVNEYLVVRFDEVCHILDGFAAGSGSVPPLRPGTPGPVTEEQAFPLASDGPVRPVTRTVASLGVRVPERPALSPWRPGELRIINVRSGTPPLTELLLVAPFPVSARSARLYLHEVARRVEAIASCVSAPA